MMKSFLGTSAFLFLAVGLLSTACGKSASPSSQQLDATALPANTVSYEVSETEFKELPSNFVFAHNIDEVSEQVSLIKGIFKLHFNLTVSVTPTLVEVSNGPLWGSYSYHKIDFGILSAEEFQRLNEYYQLPIGKRTERKHDPLKKYTIQDFLAPKIQSLAGKTTYGRFKPQSISQKPYEGEGAAYIPNCWTTVHDILTSDKAPFDLHGFNYDMDNNGAFHIQLFTKSEHFKAVDVQSLGNIKAYDVFTTIESDSLDHAGIFIAPGLVFEKAAPGSQRYGIRAMKSVVADENFGIRRLVKSLPLPSEFPNLDASEKWKAENPIKVAFDKDSGLYVPAPGSILSKSIGQYSPISTCPSEAYQNSLCENFEIRMNFIFDELKK